MVIYVIVSGKTKAFFKGLAKSFIRIILDPKLSRLECVQDVLGGNPASMARGWENKRSSSRDFVEHLVEHQRIRELHGRRTPSKRLIGEHLKNQKSAELLEHLVLQCSNLQAFCLSYSPTLPYSPTPVSSLNRIGPLKKLRSFEVSKETGETRARSSEDKRL